MLIVFTSLAFSAVYSMVQPARSTARRDATVKSARTLKEALTRYQNDHGFPVPTPSSLSYLVSDLADERCTMDTDSASSSFGRLRGWCGPYVDTIWQEAPDSFMLDGWGNAFSVTVLSGASPPYTELRSCGADRVCGAPGVLSDENGKDDIIETF